MSSDGVDVAIQPRPLAPSRSKSYEKQKKYSLFPTVTPTPPESPTSLQRLSLSKTGAPRKARSASLDDTARIAAEQQNAVVKTVAARRGRKVSVAEIRHMSTVQEMPSPTVSISYSFLPRYSEDTGHARSSSAPGEFVRDSQTLPGARIDISKPQWTSKQADTHPAKGLGLSMPASISVDRLDQRREAPNARPKPNLTIEIKNDPRMKPNAIVVRDEDIDYDAPPPPPPPKSPRHDSRNHSLNNITFEPARKVRRTRSRTASRTLSRRSNSSPDSAHPSEKATVASQGSFVKAALVDTPSPSSPAPPRPVIPHARTESFSPLSGDVKIKELMAMSSSEAQDDLERPVPPPITPGQPRVASLARVVSIPSLPKAVSVEKSAEKIDTAQREDKPTITQSETNSTDTIVPIKQADAKVQKVEKPLKEQDAGPLKVKIVRQGSRSNTPPAASPAVSSVRSKAVSTKTSKLNLDKPMPSLPPPSSRFSEHMRQVRAAEGIEDANAPPVPAVPHSDEIDFADRTEKANEKPGIAGEQVASTPAAGPRTDTLGPKQSEGAVDDGAKKQETAVTAPPGERPAENAARGAGKATKGGGLSAFPSVPPPPRYYGRGTQPENASNRGPPHQRPPPKDTRQQPPGRSSSPGRRFPPAHPLNRPVYPPFMPGSRDAPREPGPPRSRFYGRQSESANNSQTSLVEPAQPEKAENEGASSKMTSPEPNRQTRSPAEMVRSPNVPVQSPPAEVRRTPVLEAKVEGDYFKLQRPQNVADGNQSTTDAKPALLGPKEQAQDQDFLKRPSSPAHIGRAPSPSPSLRPSSPGDLLSKFSSAKSLPSLPAEPGPRPMTPEAASVLTFDAQATISDPIQTLRDLTRQSEALHARHASLRADRLKLSTAISASLKDSRSGPEYANSLLDQHLSLNAINSSLDICFAKLKSLDCKKEEAIQALLEQSKERHVHERRHRATASVTTHSTQAFNSGHSSKASTPDIGAGGLPALHEKEVRQPAQVAVIDTKGGMLEQAQHGDAADVKQNSKDDSSAPPNDADNERASLIDSLPTPKAKFPTTDAPPASEKTLSLREVSPLETAATSSEQKRNTVVKLPSVSPAPSLFTKEPIEMSPVSPIEDNDNEDDDSMKQPKRITVKGAKAAKILGLVTARSESPSGITLPDASPTETRTSPAKETVVEMKIHRKPLPGAPKGSAPPPPDRQAPVPPQPGRKRTNDSASTVQTDSSPESEVRTPRGSQEGLVPKGLKIGKKQQRTPQPVQVVSDEDILDYYSR